MTSDPCPSCKSTSTQKLGILLHSCLKCRFAWEVQPELPYITTTDVVLIVKEEGGKRRVEVARCIHCEKITIAPWSRCSCGSELYPSAALVELGVAWDAKGFLGE